MLLSIPGLWRRKHVVISSALARKSVVCLTWLISVAVENPFEKRAVHPLLAQKDGRIVYRLH